MANKLSLKTTNVFECVGNIIAKLLIITFLCIIGGNHPVLAQNEPPYIYTSEWVDTGALNFPVGDFAVLFVPYRWYAHSFNAEEERELTWAFDPQIQDQEIIDVATWAIQQWTTTDPRPDWVAFTPMAQTEFITADLRIQEGECPDRPSAIGCVGPDTWVLMVEEGVYVWRTAELWLNFNGSGDNYDLDDKRSVAAHEVGHVLGLDERYVVGVGCYDAEDSVMDTVGIVQGTREVIPCRTDPTPAALDVQRVNEFWAGASNQYVPDSIQWVGGEIEGRWFDNAWTEYAMEIGFAREAEDGTPHIFAIETRIEGIGSHQNMEHMSSLWLLRGKFSPRALGQPRGGRYTLCARPLLGRTEQDVDVVGPWRCHDWVRARWFSFLPWLVR